MDKTLKEKADLKLGATKIHFGFDYALDKLIDLLREKKRRIAMITDTCVEKLYRKDLDPLEVAIFSFHAGERAKSRVTKSKLEDQLLAHRFGSDTLLLALGGGVTTDLCGFIAATYCRGIPHIQIPTSLLAMVDASVGGKTGVNTPYGKNTIGAFHPPEEVWIDGMFLQTLPQKQWINGIVEMIKAALISSSILFDALNKEANFWEKRFHPSMMEKIRTSVEIKQRIVAEDPKEKTGKRRSLNLGHTFGHALEFLSNYKIEHGEAVAMGLLVSCYISVSLGLLSEKSIEQIEATLRAYHLPLKLETLYSVEEVIDALMRDKKRCGSSVRMVLIEEIGKVAPFKGEYCTEIDAARLKNAIDWMHEKFYNPPK